MAQKEEKIEVEGEVVESLPSTMFRVQVDGMDGTVLATITEAGEETGEPGAVKPGGPTAVGPPAAGAGRRCRG